MFRAASKIKTLQQHSRRLTSSTSTRVELSSYYSAMALPSSGDEENNGYPAHRNTTTSPVNTALLSRSFHHQSSSILKYNQYTNTTFHTNNRSATLGGARRGFASGAGDSNNNDAVDSTLEKLFEENQVLQGDATAEPWVDGAQSIASSGLEFVPAWYNPADQCIKLIFNFQEFFGVDDLALAIIGTTLAARMVLLPIVVSGQVTTSRMAHVNPELMHIRNKFDKLADPTMEDKAKMGQQVRDLFKRYGVKPLRAMIAPFVQFPFFMGMFFGLKKMPDYFPEEMANGGMLWFPDLTMPDPNYILPAVCFFTFLATVEMGKDQMIASNPQNATMMINVFRGLSLMMIPICVNFHTGMLCYWTVSNLLTLGQIALLKIPAVRNAVGIWAPPKPVPGLTKFKDEGIMAAADNLVKQIQGKPTNEAGRLKQHNERIENKKKVQELSRNSRERRRRSIKKRGA